jgi:sugar phosphate isomerase/epimerase
MPTRRSFLQQAAALASASTLAPMSQATPPRYKMGLQLYTIRDAMARDVDGTLRRIAALGYQEVETYGFDPEALGYYRMPARDFAERLRDHGLSSPSGHYDLNRFATAGDDDLNRYVDRCIEGARLVGHRYITWPFLEEPLRQLEPFTRIVGRFNAIGERMAKGGLQFAYHNHGFEFAEQNGRVPYDLVLRETDPKLVKLQIDLYWLSHDSKQPPRYWFERAPGRYVMWHVKDMHKVSRAYTELGNGSIDYTKIWPDAAFSGMQHFFVEQGGNFAQNSMQSVADCAAYVKRYLLPGGA